MQKDTMIKEHSIHVSRVGVGCCLLNAFSESREFLLIDDASVSEPAAVRVDSGWRCGLGLLASGSHPLGLRIVHLQQSDLAGRSVVACSFICTLFA